ncbi:hypothetical protein PUN28_018082 [Cardiocondyla obscurior]|uniref:Secreted protein n=1 Tax=Cardiocondyla obscurior TaxID=286306 RepID=A0AAW2EJM0_9HYME
MPFHSRPPLLQSLSKRVPCLLRLPNLILSVANVSSVCYSALRDSAKQHKKGTRKVRRSARGGGRFSKLQFSTTSGTRLPVILGRS